MKRLTILLAAVLPLTLLAGCGLHLTSPTDEAFRKDWDESMEELRDGLERDWDSAWANLAENGGFSSEKEHRWRVLDATGAELFTVSDETAVKALDDLLSDGSWERTERDPGDSACAYVYSQEKTLLAGQDPDVEREYEDLMTFTVSASEDAVTVNIPSVLDDMTLPDGLQDLLTFTCAIPAETAAALRDPAQFAESE